MYTSTTSSNAEKVSRRQDSENPTKFKFSDLPLSSRSFKGRRNYYITTQFDELLKQHQYRRIFSVISALLRTAKSKKIGTIPTLKGTRHYQAQCDHAMASRLATLHCIINNQLTTKKRKGCREMSFFQSVFSFSLQFSGEKMTSTN